MQEQHKVRRAFGYIYDYGEYPAGHVFDDEFIKAGKLNVAGDTIPYQWVFLDGSVSFKAGSRPTITAQRGSLGTTLDLQNAEYFVQADSDCRLICFSALTNAGMTPTVPNVALQRIAPGGAAVLPANTRFLVCDGGLQINDKVVGAFQASSAATGDLTVTATSDTILLVFQ